MNELKFRAIINENTKIYFTFVDLIENRFSARELLKPWLINNIPDIYIGVKDKNKLEFYTGDIIDCLVEYNLSPYDFRGKIDFDEGDFVVNGYIQSRKQTFNFEECCDIKIIGNIYENPELLND
jgi:uncharacterized phage protein (TIGR01671 family)